MILLFAVLQCSSISKELNYIHVKLTVTRPSLVLKINLKKTQFATSLVYDKKTPQQNYNKYLVDQVVMQLLYFLLYMFLYVTIILSR